MNVDGYCFSGAHSLVWERDRILTREGESEVKEVEEENPECGGHYSLVLTPL